jgi:hypothetical protein
MKGLEFITYKDKKIALMDISHTEPAEIQKLTQEAASRIAQLPAKSALILTDVTDTVYNQDTSTAMKEFSKGNTPFVRASAVVGISAVQTVLLQTISVLTGRHIRVCKDREEAMEWLSTQ